MTLVATNQGDYDSASVGTSMMSYARGANASEQARRRLKVLMEQKEKQCEQLRQTLERKKKHLDDEKNEVKALYDTKEQDDATIRNLREEKLLFRVFKQLDVEKKNGVSFDNMVNKLRSDEAEQIFLKNSLFDLLPTMYHINFRCKDFDQAELASFVADELGVMNRAIEVEIADTQTHGSLRVLVRLAWHTHPVEFAEDPLLSDEQNEERRQQIAEYYAQLSGDDTVPTPEQGRAKEEEMIEIIKTRVPEGLGYEIMKMTEDVRATIQDFISTFWNAVEEDQMPEVLKDMHRQAKQIEDDTILPEEALDRVVELEHAIKHQVKLNEEIYRDTNLTEKDIQAVDKQIDAVSKELLHIQRVTGFDSNHSKKEHVDYHLQEQEIEELSALLAKLDEEHKVGQTVLAKKTQLLVMLSQQVEEKTEVEEQVFKTINDIKVAKREIDEVLEETRKLMADHSKSDRAITTLETQRDYIAVQSLQSDKQYLQRQIANHVAAKRKSDTVIKAQAFRLGVLENRLACVTNALKDLKNDHKIQRKLKDALTVQDDDDRDPTNIESIMPQNELLDVELYELLNRSLESISGKMKLKDIILLEKEASIEATELKLSELAKEKEDDEEYYQYNTHKDVKEVEELRHQHRIRQETQRRERGALKKSVAIARKNATNLVV